MSHSLACIDASCGHRLALQDRALQCPRCEQLLDVRLDLDSIAGTPDELRTRWRARRLADSSAGVWRFRELLPFPESSDGPVISLGEGDTPELKAPQSAAYAGLRELRVKHLGFNPTGSFKDYGMTAAVTQAARLGCGTVACASTGNTSASMAAYASRGGLQGAVLVPAGQVARGKLAQTLDYGAKTLEVEGNFDEALAALRRLAADSDLYLANSVNPFRLEGQKIVMAEVAESWDWRMPEHIVVPGGNLGNVSAFGKGLHELQQLGLIDRLPKLHVIQARGAAPLVTTIEQQSGELLPVEQPQTLATAIRIGRPVSWRKALRALEWTGGHCLAVDEAGIANARAVLARDGIGCEPASATALEGTRRLVASGIVGRTERVVAILTGHQLKDPDYLLDYHSGELAWQGSAIEARFGNSPQHVGADVDAIRSALGL